MVTEQVRPEWPSEGGKIQAWASWHMVSESPEEVVRYCQEREPSHEGERWSALEPSLIRHPITWPRETGEVPKKEPTPL